MTNTPYSKLLSNSRLRESSFQGRNIVLESESDRGRLLFCPAFRRLQQKAQVFSMEPNAAVRSRLTHSLEVSQMGRYIADSVTEKLLEHKLATEDECKAIVTFVETACLMHDIGNPPFGHFGEAAISTWFRECGAEAIKKSLGQIFDEKTLNAGTKAALADFYEFDGNPQGLRIVTKLQRNTDSFGLNLTKTSIASFLKYIRQSEISSLGNVNHKINKAGCISDFLQRKIQSIKHQFTKKAGFFSTEAEIVKNVWNQFGYDNPQRFPLAYIMEAADDLAYCISDLEDSIEKGLLDKQRALNEIFQQWKRLDHVLQDKCYQSIDRVLGFAAGGKSDEKEIYTFIDFRTSLNRIIVEYCAEQYLGNHQKILDGTAGSLLEDNSSASKILGLLKKHCREHVYGHESVQRVELAGYTAISGLLEKYSCLLASSLDRFNCALASDKKDSSGKPIILEGKFIALLPKNYIDVYKDDLKKLNIKFPDTQSSDFLFSEWNLRAHLVVDFISGMTDDFAMTTYRTLSGMRL